MFAFLPPYRFFEKFDLSRTPAQVKSPGILPSPGVLAAVIFGVGMCMTMVWNMMAPGIVVGIAGIVLLICLIPICKGLK